MISKVIRKKSDPVQNNFPDDDDDEDDLFYDESLEETNIEESEIDFDSFPAT